MSAPKILISPRSLTRAGGHPALARFTEAGYELVFAPAGRQPTEAELLEILPGCVGFLAGVEPISARVLDAADGLKVIGRNGTGVSNIDLAKADELEIAICRAEGANARGVAELTLGHILAAVRSIPFADAALKGERWERRKGIELQGRTLGLVGCGSIGRIVARFAVAMDMTVLAYDLYPDASFQPSERFRYCELVELFERSDIISLHCPPAEDGRPIVNADTIARTKRGVYLINTARAALMDRDAVLAGLDAEQIAGVVVDAFDSEPPTDWRLVKHPRVIATPHIGGFTAESIARAVGVAVDKMLAVLAAGPFDRRDLSPEACPHE